MNTTFTSILGKAKEECVESALFFAGFAVVFTIVLLEGLLELDFLRDTSYYVVHAALWSMILFFSLRAFELYGHLKRAGVRMSKLKGDEKATYFKILYLMWFPVFYALSYAIQPIEQEIVRFLVHFMLVSAGYFLILAFHLYALMRRQKEECAEKPAEEKVVAPSFRYLATSSDSELSEEIVKTRKRLTKLTAEVTMENLDVKIAHDIEMGIQLFNQGLLSFEVLPKEEKRVFRTHMDKTLAYINEQMDEVYRMHYERHQYELTKMIERINVRG